MADPGLSPYILTDTIYVSYVPQRHYEFYKNKIITLNHVASTNQVF